MNTHWRIDKRIPISALIMVIVQMVMLISWASYLEARVSNNESAVVNLSNMNEKLARIEERVDGIREELKLMRGKRTTANQ